MMYSKHSKAPDEPNLQVLILFFLGVETAISFGHKYRDTEDET
jgi:hypothetical protein